jgi:hypothetical protein
MESIASNKTSFHFLLLAVLALTSQLAVQQTVAQKQNESPRIEKKAGDEVLVLPGHLNDGIRTQFPGFRVPTAKDRTGLWESDTDEGNLPFAAWGDFRRMRSNSAPRNSFSLCGIGRTASTKPSNLGIERS